MNLRRDFSAGWKTRHWLWLASLLVGHLEACRLLAGVSVTRNVVPSQRLHRAVGPHTRGRSRVYGALGRPTVTASGDVCVNAAAGHHHRYTLIYLHGYTRSGEEYLPESDLSFSMPWVAGGDRAPGLRAVLPTAPSMQQPWGDVGPSWYGYLAPNRNDVGDAAALISTRRRLAQLVRDEVRRLGGAAHRVFLGGASQGCTVALDTYLREASRLGLGGFVGSIGFVPSDSKGFAGATGALERLIANKTQAKRPVWMQCATDDRRDVPWQCVVRPSLRRVAGRLPGLLIREVSGRGHGIEDWEGHIVNDFVRQYAADAYK